MLAPITMAKLLTHVETPADNAPKGGATLGDAGQGR